MIAVDASALMAILLAEPEGDAYAAVLEAEPHVLISAGTMAEALIVARAPQRKRGVRFSRNAATPSFDSGDS